ncbi:MAG: UDP-glucose 4-epimerase GalE [Acidobacteria bacterium]|nr:MAG: UDP-glucose 4-epimerase GalE [Acidobacteriota bacterium]
MKKILVTGGAGYVGSHAVKQLQREGFPCLVLDNLVYGHDEFVNGADLIVGDSGNAELLERIFSQNEIEAVMHFAAYAYVGESVTDPAKYYQNNLVSTFSLLKAMIHAGVKKIIFSSSCATYGNPVEIPITEEHPQNPINPYGATKLMVERMLKDFDQAYGLKSIVFRYFNAAGADPEGEIGEWHEPETHLIPLVLDAGASKREAVEVYGTDYETQDGTCIREYIHVTDIAQAHVLGLKELLSRKPSQVFNLGNGSGFSVREVIRTAERVTGRKVNVVETRRRAGDPPALVGSSSKARAVLGWKPQFPSLDSILQTAWQWHQRFHRSDLSHKAAQPERSRKSNREDAKNAKKITKTRNSSK